MRGSNISLYAGNVTSKNADFMSSLESTSLALIICVVVFGVIGCIVKKKSR